MGYVGRHRKPPRKGHPYTKGGYRGGRPASEMGPPQRLPSATIRPKALPPLHGGYKPLPGQAEPSDSSQYPAPPDGPGGGSQTP